MKTVLKYCLIENIKDQTVVEIGPGKGANKVILNENPKKLLIEKDKSLIHI